MNKKIKVIEVPAGKCYADTTRAVEEVVNAELGIYNVIFPAGTDNFGALAFRVESVDGKQLLAMVRAV